ncbi:MAG: hypothetical protein K6L60_05410 [Oceanobacter sp.]
MTLDRITGPLSFFVGLTFSVVTGAIACYYAWILGGDTFSKSTLISLAAGMTVLQIVFAHAALTLRGMKQVVFGVAALILLSFSVALTAASLESLHQQALQKADRASESYARAKTEYDTHDGQVKGHEGRADVYHKKSWPDNEGKARLLINQSSTNRQKHSEKLDAFEITLSPAGLDRLSESQRWYLFSGIGTLLDVVRSLAFWLASIKATGRDADETHQPGGVPKASGSVHSPSDHHPDWRHPETHQAEGVLTLAATASNPDATEDAETEVQTPLSAENSTASSPRPEWLSLFEEGERVTPTGLKKRQRVGYTKAKSQMDQAVQDGWLEEKDGQYFARGLHR